MVQPAASAGAIFHVDSMNGVIELDGARKAARLATVPSEVFLVLFIYLVVAAAVQGAVLVGARGRISAFFLCLLFVMALILVIDIDRPVGGRIQESQEPMVLMREMLARETPEVFDRMNAPPGGFP